MKKIDVSVFNGIRQEVIDKLVHYEVVEMLGCYLYKIDVSCLKFLVECSHRLDMEYRIADEKTPKELSIYSVVNILSEEVTNSYNLYEKDSWEQVNDQDKVFDRLESKMKIALNRFKSEAKKTLAEKKASSDMVAKAMTDIDEKFKQATIKKQWVIDNRDKLDVRISTYHRRQPKYAFINFRAGGKVVNKRLRDSVPNVIFYEDKELRDNNELAVFFKDAINLYGDIYYRELKEGEERKIVRAYKKKSD